MPFVSPGGGFADEFAVEDASKLPDSTLFLDSGMVGYADNSDDAEESGNETDHVKTRKRRKSSREPGEDRDIVDTKGRPYADPALLEMSFPKHFEAEFATAIFELGLKNSSPKVPPITVLA